MSLRELMCEIAKLFIFPLGWERPVIMIDTHKMKPEGAL
jgi:hypothetical protein